MAVSLNTFLSISSLLLIFAASFVTAQLPNNTAETDFMWSEDSPNSCETYVTYRAKSPYADLRSISDLFKVSKMDISTSTNLASENAPLVPDQLLFIPIKCSSNGTHYFSNVSYRIQKGDNYYSVSTKAFENLTNHILVGEMNPLLIPTNLSIGAEVVFPLLCKCPGKSYTDRGIRFLITYTWQPHDDILSVSTMFQTTTSDIVTENNNRNFTAAICLPVLIPEKSPIVLQRFPSPAAKSKHRWMLIAVLSASMAVLIISSGLAAYFHFLNKKRKNLAREDSSLDTSDCFPPYKAKKGKTLEVKIIQDKLLPGVSGYLGKTITYDLHEIMKATMNLSERYRIGGSVYKAKIDDQILAVKKTRDATEELHILQRVNHANLVKLMGISTDNEGNFYIVYEYAERGSVDNWLFPKVTTSSPAPQTLSWNQRLYIALDVANGLQYLHEHTQPSIVHKDVTTSNILLDSNFKAKISNFSTARPATSPIMLNVDVFSFGVILLELLSGKKVMETNDNGEVVMLWKEIKGILESDEDQRKGKLRQWMDPNLMSSYIFDDALSLAILGRACTLEKASERPRMGEIVFNLSVLTQSSPKVCEQRWNSGYETEEFNPVTTPVIAR